MKTRFNNRINKLFSFVFEALKRNPLPSPLVNFYLMARWSCYIHPFANIGYPFSISLGKKSVIGKCKIVAYSKIFSGKTILIGEKTRIGDGVVLNSQGGFIHIGDAVSVHDYSIIYGFGGVTIGNDTRIAAASILVSHNHKFNQRGIKIREIASIPKPIKIGEDVWLGAGSRVLGGVEIDDFSIIAAGAVVTSNVRSEDIVAGVPARVIKQRFEVS